MLAISLWQPWATLLVGEQKQFETRSWSLARRRPVPIVLAIHAARKWNRDLSRLCITDPFLRSLESLGYDDPQLLPFGAIVGVVLVRKCVPTSEAIAAIGPKELSFGDYSTGRWAWVCDRFVGLSVPVPCVGRQGLFHWEPPGNLLLPDWTKGEDLFS